MSPTSCVKLAWLLLALAATGCTSTYDLVSSKPYTLNARITSDPPGYDVYAEGRHLGQTPLLVRRGYSHVTEEITFGAYRTGIVLLITGGSGVAAGGAMIGTAVAFKGDDSDASAGLAAIGALALIYGLTGVAYGTIAMVGSEAPRVAERTDPPVMRFGIKDGKGRYSEMQLSPIDRNSRRIHFKEARAIIYDGKSGTWDVPGLSTLKVEKRE